MSPVKTQVIRPDHSKKRHRHRHDNRQACAGKSHAASAPVMPDRGIRYTHGDPLYASFR